MPAADELMLERELLLLDDGFDEDDATATRTAEDESEDFTDEETDEDLRREEDEDEIDEERADDDTALTDDDDAERAFAPADERTDEDELPFIAMIAVDDEDEDVPTGNTFDASR